MSRSTLVASSPRARSCGSWSNDLVDKPCAARPRRPSASRRAERAIRAWSRRCATPTRRRATRLDAPRPEQLKGDSPMQSIRATFLASAAASLLLVAAVQQASAVSTRSHTGAHPLHHHPLYRPDHHEQPRLHHPLYRPHHHEQPRLHHPLYRPHHHEQPRFHHAIRARSAGPSGAGRSYATRALFRARSRTLRVG